MAVNFFFKYTIRVRGGHGVYFHRPQQTSYATAYGDRSGTELSWLWEHFLLRFFPFY